MAKGIGAEYRQQERLKQIEKIKRLAARMFEKSFPNPTHPPSIERFTKEWESINQELIRTFGAIRDYKLAFNHLVHLINSQKQNNNWQVSAPSYLITQKATKQLRTQAWLKQAWAFQAAYSRWFDSLNHITTPAQCYQALMFSFMCHSGHCHRLLVESFSAWLVHPTKLYQYNELVFVSLVCHDRGYNTNDYCEDGNAITRFHCYLSPITLGLLRLWNKLDRKQWLHPNNQPQIYDAITYALSSTSSDFPTTLSKLASCAIFTTENLPDVDISQALIEYAIGHTKSYSLPLPNLARLTTNKVHSCAITRFYDFSSRINISLTDSTPNHFIARDNLYEALAKAIKKDNPKTKLSAKTLRERLQHLASAQRPLNQKMLLEWLIEKSYSCKPSTIATYHASLSRRWLFATNNQPLCQLDSDEFEALYVSLIDDVKTSKRKSYLAARLSQLHGFGVSQYGLAPLQTTLDQDVDDRKHTRAGFIDEALFTSLLAHITQLTDINDGEKITLQAIMIMGYRTGLRLSELLKLQLRDIEPSRQGWTRVTNNVFGNNKTPAARRKIPLFPLLLEQEIKIIDQHLSLTKAKAGNQNRLVFTLGQDGHLPIDPFLISNFTKHALNELSGLNHLVFHHLRHSCLSRLQVMVEIDHAQRYLPNVVPYHAKQQSKIMHLICGQSIRNKYYALAAFAGHSSPETCFNNYFHFSDWLLAHKLINAKISMTKQSAMALSLCSRGQYQSLKKNHANVYPFHCTQYLINRLKPNPLSELNVAQTAISALNITINPTKKYSIELCYKVLEHLEQGVDIKDIAFNFRLDNSAIERWVKNAKYIKNLHSNSSVKKPRHFSDARRNKLVPAPLRSTEERGILSKWVVSFREHYNDKREEINWAIQYALTHTNINQSGIYFNQPTNLRRFIAAVDFAIPKSYWRAITNSVKHSAIKADWQNAYQGISRRANKKSSPVGRSGNGTVRLELRHPNEPQITSQGQVKKFSSPALMYLFHMMGIMMFKDK